MANTQGRQNVKKLLNQEERQVEKRLICLSERRRAHVRSMIRLADVFPIERSGLSNRHYSFALKSHFDFVVVDGNERPLFAVELDGPSHQDSRQIERDTLKNDIAEFFKLSLMRITTDDLERSESRIDRLTEMVELWFDRYEVKNGHLAVVTNEVSSRQIKKLQARPVGPTIQVSQEPLPATTLSKKELTVTGITLAILFLGLFVFALIPEKEKGSDVEETRAKVADSRKWENDAATYRQKSFLDALVRRQGLNEEERDAEMERILGYRQSYFSLTKGEASQLISAWDEEGRSK